MRLVDTHTHIHESSYPLDREEVLGSARDAGVAKLPCVGTDVRSSGEAVAFGKVHPDVFASIGVHPHESAGLPLDILESVTDGTDDTVVAVGEIGLDYHYTHSPREAQLALFESQLQYAVDHGLPVIFHVREAFDDFWPVFGNFKSVRGVLHSFTDTVATLERAVTEGLHIGVNGISTFTKDPLQQAMFDRIPLELLLLGTDAPYLTPAPLRGKINQLAYVSLVASYHAARRGISEDQIASTTTANAEALFGI